MKKFNQNSLDKIRNSPRLRKKRFHRDKQDKEFFNDEQLYSFKKHRLTASHPELSCSNLAQLSNYQSFDDLNLITIHHNSENYLSDNIEFHKKNGCPLSSCKCRNGSICENETNLDRSNLEHQTKTATTFEGASKKVSIENKISNNLEKAEENEKIEKANAISTTNEKTCTSKQLSFSGTSTPTSFFSRFRSSSPNNLINEDKKSTNDAPFNVFRNTSCSTFLTGVKRPHSSLNYNESMNSRKLQYKQTEAFSASEDDLLLDATSEQQSVKNLNLNTSNKRRDSFLLKLLKKRNPLDRTGSAATNYEYYNQSLDEDYENSVSQNVSSNFFFPSNKIFLVYASGFTVGDLSSIDLPARSNQ